MVERRRAWHVITAFGQHTRSNDVRCGMTSPPLDYTHGRTWHVITAFGKHTRLNDIARGMPSLPLDSTHGRTRSGVAFHHRLWEAQTVERRRAWHAIIHLWAAQTVERRRAWIEITALGLHAPSDDVRHGMTSPPLYCTHDRKTSGVA